MDGLLQILDSFDGIENLPSSQELQLALFWYSLRSFDLQSRTNTLNAGSRFSVH